MVCKRYLRSILWLTVAGLAAIVTFIVVIDPYSEFNVRTTDMRSFEATPLLTYSHAEKLRHDSYTLVFGTSRSAMIGPDETGGNTLNFHALYGHPQSVYDFLTSLDDTQISHIRSIFYLADIHVYDPEYYTPPDLYGHVTQRTLYRLKRIGPTLRAAVQKFYKNATGRFDRYVDERGYTVFLQDRGHCNLPVRRDPNAVRPMDDPSQAAYKKIVQFASRHHIEITFATPAFSNPYLASLDPDALMEQKRRLIEATGGIHDFITLDHPLTDCAYILDPSHLNKAGIHAYFQLIQDGRRFTRIPLPVAPTPLGLKLPLDSKRALR